jgi:hypothetical protein
MGWPWQMRGVKPPPRGTRLERSGRPKKSPTCEISQSGTQFQAHAVLESRNVPHVNEDKRRRGGKAQRFHRAVDCLTLARKNVQKLFWEKGLQARFGEGPDLWRPVDLDHNDLLPGIWTR